MLRLENINKKVGKFSLNKIDFSVDKGDYFVLIGESGAGKSILLELIAGLLTPDGGTIFLNEKNILNTPIQERNIGIVYQNPSLFPHLSVFENIAYPLKIKKSGRNEIAETINKLAEEFEISHLLQRRTSNLSGGEIQRVTIARTLATNPQVLMLDEPLSFLDVQLKRGISSLLRKLNQNGQTILHVTHDYEEAIALANKIAIIENGTIIQTGSPREVFHNPKSEFVANFIGIKNFLKGKLISGSHDPELKIFETSGIKLFTITGEEPDSEGYVIIPGEAILISEERINSSATNNYQGTITDIYPTKLGLEVVIDIGIELSAQITHLSFDRMNLAIGKQVWINIKAGSVGFRGE